MSDESLEGLHQPEFSEAVLGRTVWRVRVPGVSYEAYLAAQKRAGRQLRRQRRSKLIPLLIVGWIAVFLGSVALTVIYKSTDTQPVVLLMMLFLCLFVFYTIKYQRLVSRKIYESGIYDNFSIALGDNGILLASTHCVQFFAWGLIEAVVASERDFVMVTRSCLLVIIPEADLRQIPDQDAMVAFAGDKVAGSFETSDSSASKQG